MNSRESAQAYRTLKLRCVVAAAHEAFEDFTQLLPTEIEDTYLVDLCALIQADLRFEHQAFLDTESKPGIKAWQLMVAGLGLISKVLNAVIAVENALSTVVGRPARLDLHTETETALRVRQAYCRFWRSLPQTAPRTAAELNKCLHESHFALSWLTDRTILLDLRHADRRLLVSLKRRVRVSLRSRGTSENRADLARELLAFGGLLSEINNRSELVEHDQHMAIKLLAIARQHSADADIGLAISFRADLESMLGFDRELDDLLLITGSPLAAGRVCDILDRRVQASGRGRAPLESIDTESEFLGESCLVQPPSSMPDGAWEAGRSPDRRGVNSKTSSPEGERTKETTFMSNIRESLDEAMRIDGAIAVALVDYNSGMSLGTAGGNALLNIEVAAAGNTAVVRAKMKVMKDLGLKDGIEDILITLGKQYHLLRPLQKAPNLFIYLATERDKSNLALARHRLGVIEENLNIS